MILDSSVSTLATGIRNFSPRFRVVQQIYSSWLTPVESNNNDPEEGWPAGLLQHSHQSKRFLINPQEFHCATSGLADVL